MVRERGRTALSFAAIVDMLADDAIGCGRVKVRCDETLYWANSVGDFVWFWGMIFVSRRR